MSNFENFSWLYIPHLLKAGGGGGRCTSKASSSKILLF